MSRSRHMLVAAAVGLCVAGSASAPAEAGQALSSQAPRIKTEGTQQGDVVRGTINAYGRCLVARKRRAVMAAVSAPADSVEQNMLLAAVSVRNCLEDGELRMPPALVRGAIFRALYRAEFGRSEPTLVAAPIDWSGGSLFDPSSAAGYAVVLRQFADCVVRGNPAAVRALTLARERSAEETAAFDLMKPDLAQCIPAGTQIEFSKSTLFSLLAEVLYRDSAKSVGSR